MFALRLHAEGNSDKEISNAIHKNYTIEISPSSIWDTCRAKKYQHHIDHFRTLFYADIKKVPIANKRVRLEDKEQIRKKLMNRIKINPLTSKVQRDEFLSFAHRLNQIEAEAREEMEKKPHLFGELIGAMREYSDGDLKQRKKELILKYRTVRGDFDEDGRAGLDGIDPDSTGSRPEDQDEPD